jgi:hypothetical protein
MSHDKKSGCKPRNVLTNRRGFDIIVVKGEGLSNPQMVSLGKCSGACNGVI